MKKYPVFVNNQDILKFEQDDDLPQPVEVCMFLFRRSKTSKLYTHCLAILSFQLHARRTGRATLTAKHEFRGILADQGPVTDEQKSPSRYGSKAETWKISIRFRGNDSCVLIEPNISRQSRIGFERPRKVSKIRPRHLRAVLSSAPGLWRWFSCKKLTHCIDTFGR